MSRFTTGVPARKVAVIASLGLSLVNFRIELLARMVANGHEVLALAPEIDAATAEALDRRGIRYATFPLDRTGINPLQDLRSLAALTAILRRERPDLVLPYTMKPIVYGALAARLAGVPRCFALFTGLAYAFSEENPRGKRRPVRAVSVLLHRVALRRIDGAFVYNPSEERDIRRFRLVPDRVPLIPVPGSGVDLDHFAAAPPPAGLPSFLMICRLLRSKGIPVLVTAARLLRERGVAAEIRLLGPMDSNPDAITADELDGWVAGGLITYLGQARDVRPHLRDCSVLVLPAVLREGTPRTVLEAMATGRAVITTDAPGCAETVAHGASGLVVPSGDPEALAQAMERLARDPELAARMGAAGRKRAEEIYDVHKVNRLLLTRMGLEPS